MLLHNVTMVQDKLAASQDFNSTLIVEKKTLEVIYLTGDLIFVPVFINHNDL